MADFLQRRETAPVPSDHHKAEVGRRLKLTIEALGLSQAEVARGFSGVTPSKLGNWLRGDNYPETHFVTQFCDRYGVTMDWIYRGVLAGASASVADAIWKAAQETPAA